MNGNSKEEYREGNYEFYIEKVFDEVCKKNRYPIKQKYAEAIARYRNKNDPSLKNIKEKEYFTAENVRPNVSRALDRLCNKENPPIICIQNKYYVPNNGEYLYEILCDKYLSYLQDKIIVENKDVLLISYNMCAFWAYKNPNYLEEDLDINEELEEFESNGKTLQTAHSYIARCLEDYCFGVFGESDFIQVMVKHSNNIGVVPNEKSKDFAVIRALEYALIRIYEQQHNTLKPVKIPDFQV